MIFPTPHHFALDNVTKTDNHTNTTSYTIRHPSPNIPNNKHLTSNNGGKMKFYPLKEWRKGQEVVVIDGEKYYTLEAATNWGMNKEQEEKVTLAAHRGENWLKKGKYKVTAGDKDKNVDDILGKVFASRAAKLVASQPEPDVPALVATTQLAYQDAGTITLDPAARKKAEAEAEAGGKKNRGKKDNEKKNKEKKTFTFSPPLTRARKRMR